MSELSGPWLSAALLAAQIGASPAASIEAAPPLECETPARYYPKAAQRAHIEGRTVLRCVVAETGQVKDCVVKLEEPAGWEFGRAALCLSPQFKMKPATRDGVPIQSEVDIPLNFRLPPDN